MGLFNNTAFFGIFLILVAGAVIAEESDPTWDNFSQEVKELLSKFVESCEGSDSPFPSPLCPLMQVLYGNFDTANEMIYQALKNINPDLPDRMAERAEPFLKFLFIVLNSAQR